MTLVYSRQCRTIADVETAADDALTVRAINELHSAVLNFKAVYGPKLLSEMFPGYVSGTPEPFRSTPLDITEQVIQVFAPREIAHGYDVLHWQIAGKMHGSATGNTVWRLYVSEKQYRGPVTMDTDFLGLYVTDSVTISSTSHVAPAAQEMDLFRDSSNMVNLTITAQNSASGDYEYCLLSSIDGTAKIAAAGV